MIWAKNVSLIFGMLVIFKNQWSLKVLTKSNDDVSLSGVIFMTTEL